MLIDLDKFIASMIEAFPAFKEEGRIPCMYKEALEAQGLEYKDGEIVKTQRMVSSDVKEDGCGVSEDKRIMEKIIATIRLYYGVPLEDEAKEMIVWLEKQGSEPNWCHHKVDLSNCSEEYRKAYYDGWNNCNQQHSQCKSEWNDVVKCLINGLKFYYEDNEEATWGTEKFSMKVKDILSWLEKQQGEQNHSEQDLEMVVKPKFNIGDWITSDEPYINNDYHLCKVVGISDGCYTIQTIDGLKGYNTFKGWESEYRLWSIEDAKPGDVLKEDSCIFIVKYMENNKDHANTHFTLFDDGDFEVGGTLIFDESSTVPATKSQRDILFAKMYETGYIFDFEKKELKKLKFKVGDEVITKNEKSLTITKIDEEGYWSNDLFICGFNRECDWDLVEKKPAEWKQENREELTEFENAMMHIGGSFFGENAGLDPNDTDTIKEQAELLLELAPKTEWSEENERNLRRAIRTTQVVYPVTADWLESIKQRHTWKPSDEQMHMLRRMITALPPGEVHNGLESLYNDLKKLTE